MAQGSEGATPRGTGLDVTRSEYEAPFSTPTMRLGTNGLELRKDQDTLEGAAAILTNMHHDNDGELRARNGLTSYATAGVNHHSYERMNHPRAGTATAFWGIDSSVYRGASGALVLTDSGYSGNPLTMVEHRVEQSGEPWIFVGDDQRNRKIRSDGLTLTIGLPEPAAAPAAVLAAPDVTYVAHFDAADGTEAAAWTGHGGFNYSEPPVATGPAIANVGQGPYGSPEHVEFAAIIGAAVPLDPTGYYSFWDIAKVLDLSTVGAVPASDEDIFHLWTKFSHPDKVTEARIYFTITPTFTSGVVPGTSQTTDASGTRLENSDFYVKSFRQSDFALYLSALGSNIASGAVAQENRAISQADVQDVQSDLGLDTTDPNYVTNMKDELHQRGIATSSGTTASVEASGGAHEWVEFGKIGVPLRRGDFQRVGSDPALDWADVSGITILLILEPGVTIDVSVAFDNFYLTGGYGPDSIEPGALLYDYRYTHFDPRTGEEGNPSPEMATTAFVGALRSKINVTPVAFGAAAMRQRIYRRGGSLINDWFYVGENTSDGGVYVDILTDSAIIAAGQLELDHWQAVPSVDASGVVVKAAPVRSFFGPINDVLFALGDKWRPGHLYYSLPNEPDHWPAENHVEVCSPSEELMAGVLFGGQGFVWSRRRLYAVYPSLTQLSGVTVTPTPCKRGLVSPWSWAVGPGSIFFCDFEGVWSTTGGEPTVLSLSIEPLFRGQTVNGYEPIDFSTTDHVRLAVFEHELWLKYRDTGGATQVMVFSLVHNFWRHYKFGVSVNTVTADETADARRLIVGGSGVSYTHEGTSDFGQAIACQWRSGSEDFGKPREDKLFGDLIVDITRNDAVAVTAQTFLNNEQFTGVAQSVGEGVGRERYIFDPFGTGPQQGRNLALDISWSTGLVSPVIHFAGVSIITEPDIIMQRVTQWDKMSHPYESYLFGVTIQAQTYGEDITLLVEYDLGGVILTAATIVLNCDGRHRRFFTWPVVHANFVRLRPTTDCGPWKLYELDWIADPQPARIPGWDSNWEEHWDTYHTGLDLDCDTFGATKTVEVYADTQIGDDTTDPVKLLGTFPVVANGRKVVHITLPWGRAHLYRFVAIDANDGLLYNHRWHLDAEPSEQTNWNQNFTVAGALPDKYLKAIILECDTYGVNKTVTIEVDHVVVETLTVNANDRQVLEFSFAQHLGRVFRLWATDANQGRLYNIQWVFDQEPLALSRWETQELDHGLLGWQTPLFAHITLKSTADVTLQITVHGQSGNSKTLTYIIPHTSGRKQKLFLPFEAYKGVLFKWVLTSTVAFWLYREESHVIVQPWGGDQPMRIHPWGNDDLDITRTMTSSALAAARSGGGTG